MFDEIMQVVTNVGFILFKQNGKLSDTLSQLNATLQVINTRLDCIEDTLKIKKED